jgi:hypothetical protein
MVNDDSIIFTDSEDKDLAKRLTLLEMKVLLKEYFDQFYPQFFRCDTIGFRIDENGNLFAQVEDDGFCSLRLEENGDLWADVPYGKMNPWRYDQATGDLFMYVAPTPS